MKSPKDYNVRKLTSRNRMTIPTNIDLHSEVIRKGKPMIKIWFTCGMDTIAVPLVVEYTKCNKYRQILIPKYVIDYFNLKRGDKFVVKLQNNWTLVMNRVGD